MWVPREVHIRARGRVPFERRQPGLFDALSAVLNPILGGTTTTTPNQPAPTTTPAAAKPPSATTPSPADTTASPNTASPNATGPNAASPNLAVNPVNNGASGGPTVSESSNPPTSNGGSTSGLSSGESIVVAASTAGSHTGTASLPSSSSAAGGNKSGTSSGATSSDGPANGDSQSVKGSTASGSGSGSESDLGTGGGGSGSTSGSGTPGNGGFIPAPSDVNTLGDANGKGNNTHGGAIAAAVIFLVLLGIGIVVLILRRRSSARRGDQANKWWFTRRRMSQTYDDTEVLNIGTSSRRSSFATTVDYSNASFLGKTAILPPPPPMAEVGRSKGTAPTLVLDVNVDQNRFSIGSAGSENSQFLVVLHRESLLLEATSSARTESFPFPKPPMADSTSLHSKGSERSRFDSKQVGDISKIISASSPSLTLIPIPPLLPDDPFADNNPFDDVPAASADLGQIRIGTVRRPFCPQLQDELRVNLGDSLRILRSFDDGWALAVKIGGSDGEQGFIPMECFHEGLYHDSAMSV